MSSDRRAAEFATWWPILVILAAVGCSATTEATLAELGNEPTPAGVFTTDAASYRATKQSQVFGVNVVRFTVVTRYSNPTSDPIRLATCRPDTPPPMHVVVGAGQGSETGIAYNIGWACVAHDRDIIVPPGAFRLDTIELSGPNDFDGVTHVPLAPTVEGRFQLRFGAMRCPVGSTCVLAPDSLRYTNVFTVRVN